MTSYIKTINKIKWKGEIELDDPHSIYIPQIFKENLTGKKLRDIIFSEETEKSKYSTIDLINERNEDFIIYLIDENATIEEIMKNKNKKSEFAWIKRVPVLFQHSYFKIGKISGNTLFQDTDKIRTYILNRKENPNNRTFVQGGLDSKSTHYVERPTIGENPFKSISDFSANHIQQFPTYDFNGNSKDLVKLLKDNNYRFQN